MRALAAWLALGAAVSGGLGLAFNSYRTQPQIYLGSIVPEGRFVQVVGLTYRNQREPWCTGALIGTNLVLTAAHCVCREPPSDVFVGNDPRKGVQGRSEYYPVERFKPAAACNEDFAGRDFALLKLDRVVPGVAPLAFLSDPAADALQGGTIVGYGATDINSSTDDYRKRYAVVPVLSVTCRGSVGQRYGCIEGTEFVGGKPNFPDTCKGDSGGPLLSVRTLPGTNQEEILLAGITSRAVRGSQHSCGEGGIYERMNQRARNWIASARAAIGA